MKAILSAAMALLLACGVAFSQSYTFKVLANRGQNQIKRQGQMIPLRTGTTLMAGDEIISADRSYIGLMHKTGKTLEIRTKGVNKVQELEKKISTGNSSVASRYANYISAKMNQSNGEGGSYRSRMNTTGAVSRGKNFAIIVAAKDDFELYGDQFLLRWVDTTNQTNGYIIEFKNIFDENIKTIETTETKYLVDMTDPTLSEAYGEEGLVQAVIRAKGTEGENPVVSKPIGIKPMSDEARASMDEELMGLKSEMDMSSPLTNIILASYFEDKGQLIDALTYYEKAVNDAPDVTDFKELYESFLYNQDLLRAGL